MQEAPSSYLYWMGKRNINVRAVDVCTDGKLRLEKCFTNIDMFSLTFWTGIANNPIVKRSLFYLGSWNRYLGIFYIVLIDTLNAINQSDLSQLAIGSLSPNREWSFENTFSDKSSIVLYRYLCRLFPILPSSIYQAYFERERDLQSKYLFMVVFTHQTDIKRVAIR